MKNTRIRSLLLLLALIVILSNLQGVTYFSQKAEASEINQVPEGFIGIYTPEELSKIRDNLNGNYILMNDIDLSESTSLGGEFYHDGYGWNPIGSEWAPFTGTFDGNGFEISGLHITNRTGSVGLFGASNQANFENIGIINSSITVKTITSSSTYYGGLVGKATDTTIENTYSGVNIAVHLTDQGYGPYPSFLGGLVGRMTKTSITNSFGYGNISAIKIPEKSYYSTSATAGTLVGLSDSYSTITNSYSVGRLAVFSKSYDSSKGILSKGSPQITNSFYLKDNRAQPANDPKSRSLNEMLEQSTYDGFDFENTWLIDKESGYPFPKFKKHQIQLKENTTDFSGGMGTVFSPYKIASAEQLKAIKSYINSYFELVNDIDLSTDSLWDPIGTKEAPFSGAFNGNGHTISGLTINLASDKELAVGLFGYVNSASIKDVGVVNSSININRGSAKEFLYSGGIAGYLIDSNLDDVFTDNKISASAKYHNYTGGIVGYLSNSAIVNSYNLGDVHSYSSDYSSFSGGITGAAVSSSLAQVYNSGNINASSTFSVAYPGGISGLFRESKLNNSFNFGNIHGSSWSGNPFPGALIANASQSEVSHSYSIGKVDGSSLNGNILGSITGSKNDSTITSCYYFNSLDNQNETVDDPYNKTIEEMKVPSTFEGFDFNNVWRMDGNIEYKYPVLVKPNFAAREIVNTINFKSLPDKLVYQEGEDLDLSGTVLTVSSNFIRTFDVPVTTDMLSRYYYPYQPGEQTLSISYGNFSIDFTVTVIEKDRIPPNKPTVNGVTDKTTVVSGRAEAGSTVHIRADNVLLGEAIVEPDGTYAVTIPVQKAGTIILIDVTDKAENVSEQANVVIYPSAPMGLNFASNSYNSVKGSWKKASEISGYEVWRAESSTGTYKKITSTSGSSYTNTSLNTGTTYYYKVRSYIKGTKTIYSSFSDVVSAQPIPSTPASVKAGSSSYTSIKTSWASVSGASGYQIYRATSINGTYTHAATTTSTNYNNSGLSTNKPYYYKVRSYRVVGGKRVYSKFSSVVSAKPIPSVPANFKVSRASSTSLKLSWSKVSGASGYQIYRSTSKSGTYSLLKSTTSLSYTNSKLTHGKVYYYKLRTFRVVKNEKVYSKWTSVISMKP